MQWWLVNKVTRPGGPRGPQQTNYVVIQSASRPINTISGPYATKTDALNARNNANAAGNSPQSGATAVAESQFSGITAVGDFANKLTQANTWLRIAEGLLGLVLIGVALAKLTGADNAISKAAVTAAKVVK
jgi:hypothetical protein